MCDFCENIKNYNEYGNHWFGEGVLFNPEEKEYCLAQNDREYDFNDYLDIKFCPMCGRKLSEETEEQSTEELLTRLKEKMTEEDYKTLQNGIKSFSDGVNALWGVLGKGIENEETEN